MIDQSQSCKKCGTEITTGLMAAFCEHGEECEFVDGNWESVKFFRDLFTSPQQKEKTE